MPWGLTNQCSSLILLFSLHFAFNNKHRGPRLQLSVPLCVLWHLIVKGVCDVNTVPYHQGVTNEEMEAEKLKQVNPARGSVADSRAWPEPLARWCAPWAVTGTFSTIFWGEILGSRLGSRGPLWPLFAKGFLLWLLAWFFPIWSVSLLSVLSKWRFISQKGCKTRAE